MDLNQINFVTALHGNERMPVLALASAGIPQIIGNPRALAENKRFLEADLNGVFGDEPKNYEAKRAQELLEILDKDKYIADFHTFLDGEEPFAIIVDLDMLDLARATGLKHIAYMKFNIKKGKALINFRKGVSIEVGQHDAPKSFETTLKIIENLQKDTRAPEAFLYEVFGEITETGEYKNFEKHPDGFYPLFANKNTYGNYGLKAIRRPLYTP